MKWKIFILIFVLICSMLLWYRIGVFHGNNQIILSYSSNLCEKAGYEFIYPFGCKLDTNAKYCIHPKCMAIGYNYDGAMCYENITNFQIIDAIISTGCPVEVEWIGINKYTGHENWKVNRISKLQEEVKQ